MKKLYLIFTLCLFLLIPSVSANAANDTTIYTEGYFEYVIEDNAISICGYFGKETEITVPAMIAGYPVSKISEDAFVDCKTIEKVNLPDTIMEIENGAFGMNQSVVYNSNVEKPEDSEDSSSGNEETKPDNAKPENSQSGTSQAGSSDSGSSQTGNAASESSKSETMVTENTEVKADNKTTSATGTVKTEMEETGEKEAEEENGTLEEAESEQTQEPGFEEVEVTLDEEDFVADSEKSKGNGGAIGIVILVVAAAAIGGIILFKKKG